MVIKTVLFDLGNVIVPFDFKLAYSRLQPLCSFPAAEIPQRLRGSNLVMRFETGQVSAEEFVRDFSGLLNVRISYDDFCDIWTSVFLPEPLIAEALLARLAERRRLMILSNTNPIHFEMIRNHYPLMRHFHHYVLSYEVGAIKPSPEIFRAAIARAECAAEECFFTDDLAPNIEAARKHGMDAVQFQSEAQLKLELKARALI